MPSPPTVSRRELLGAERSLEALASGDARLTIALIYPNTYHVGMSSLGFQITHRVMNLHPGVRAERFFTDTLAQGSIESGTPLGSFDILAFSASFEMDMPSVLDVIEAVGLPLEARERDDPRMPLVLMGGVLVDVNRLPLYPFIDFFLHGESEVILPPALDALVSLKDSGDFSQATRLHALASLPGIEPTPGAMMAAGAPVTAEEELAAFVPRDVTEDERLPRIAKPPSPTLASLNGGPCATQILSPHTEFSDMVLIDLARGCPHHCTFCWIGHNSPPYRERAPETIFRNIEAWSKFTDRFGLVSGAVGAHPAIDEICRWIMQRDLRVSYSSLRVEEVTPTMLEALAKGGQKTITIAPETGNERLRRLLGKRIADEEIFDVVRRALALGIQNIKQYFMVGIPSESEEEAMEIATFAERVREVMIAHGRKSGRLGWVGINLGVFVPKPNLPLNHIEPLEPSVVKKRLKKVVQRLRRIPNVRLAVASHDLALAQSVLSVGGIEASRYLRIVRAQGGDWRAANRHWREESARHAEGRRRASRLPAEKITARPVDLVRS